MNVKKQLQKVLDYVNDLEAENTFLDSKVAELENPNTYNTVFHYYTDEDTKKIVEENARLSEQLAIYEKTRSIQAYTDLVTRIEKLQEQLRWHPVTDFPKRKECDALRAENERLREALQKIKNWCCVDPDGGVETTISEMVEQALKGGI